MAPPTAKRPRASGVSAGGRKKARSGSSLISAGASRAKQAPERTTSQSGTTATNAVLEKLRQDFIRVFDDPKHSSGVSNKALKLKFGDRYIELVPIINELTRESRLNMSKVGDELFYNLVSDEMAVKFSGLDVSARMVYQVIEKAGNMGIWTKDIRTQTNMQQQALNKIFKALEGRRLIKPVKSVTAKAKKLYMAYNLAPAKEITGGPWYTELEFDHEFISELRTFLLHCVRKLNGGRGVSLQEIRAKMVQANVSRVQLSAQDVQQLLQTLVFDYKIEKAGTNAEGEVLFVVSRTVTPVCEFKWWDVLCQDFHFRTIRFEDDVVLSAHEPHHHTS